MSNFCCLICLGHLIRSKAERNRIFFPSQNTYFPLCVRVLSYHPIKYHKKNPISYIIEVSSQFGGGIGASPQNLSSLSPSPAPPLSYLYRLACPLAGYRIFWQKPDTEFDIWPNTNYVMDIYPARYRISGPIYPVNRTLNLTSCLLFDNGQITKS